MRALCSQLTPHSAFLIAEVHMTQLVLVVFVRTGCDP